MKLCLFNANGILGKADEIMHFVRQEHIDICLIVETWLSRNEQPPIGGSFLNICHANDEVIVGGGRRRRDGILCFSPNLSNHIQTSFVDEVDELYGFFELGDIIYGIAYIPPSVATTKLEEFLTKAEELTDNFTKKCVLAGDFNARMGEATNDGKHSQPRGTWLLNWIRESPLEIIVPKPGEFTTVSHNGQGVTDLFLTNLEDEGELKCFTAVDLGGSDHRPVVWEFEDNSPRHKSFTRWDVRKLADNDVRMKYREEIQESSQAVLQYIRDVHTQVAESQGLAERMDQQDGINLIWNEIQRWIENAAATSCGTFRYKSSTNQRFWDDEETRAAHQRVQDSTAELHGIMLNHPSRLVRRGAAQELKRLNQELRAQLKKRRADVWDEMVNNLADQQNQGAFLRMVKNQKGRRSRKVSKLKPQDMENHEQHFETTFGGSPNGIVDEFEGGNEIPANLEYIPTRYDSLQVRNQMKKLAHGKAAGPDGVMAELITYGGEPMTQVCVDFFNLMNLWAVVPTLWTSAWIIPIFKNKGSDLEIRNYRPIALTCVFRRLYERMIKSELDGFTRLLSDFQGGFRPHRSTLDQVFCLQEITLANPDLINVYLDLQAAYDLVDRRILWSKLYHRFGIPWSLIRRLKQLFDFNKSHLLIAGQRSDGIDNTRGLLQGSSLSPILFNFFINDLIVELSTREDCKKVTTAGVRTNCLFFADDGNLHARSIQDMRALLAVCERWSIRVGMKFAPTKCVVTGKEEVLQDVFQLYGEPLPVVEQTAYLGILFDRKGIHWGATMQKRIRNARGTIMALGKLGFNGTGWPTAASAAVYKSFVRPQLEYGLALTLLKKSRIKKVQQVQNLAMRMITSAPRNTSTNAHHRLLQLETMEFRNQKLNVKFATKLHNSRDQAVPAIKIWRNRVQQPPAKSLVAVALQNPLWQRANRMNHLFNQLRDRDDVNITPPFTKEEFKQISRSSIRALDLDETNVAGTIIMDEIEPKRNCILPHAFSDRKQRVAVIHWIVGAVARHQDCLNCGLVEGLSRKHALECSGALRLLQERYPNDIIPASPLDAMSQVLNKFRHRPNNKVLYRDVHQCVAMIYTRCLGLLQAENGFFNRNPDAQPVPQVPQRQQNAPQAQDRNQVPEVRLREVRNPRRNPRGGRGRGTPRNAPAAAPRIGVG